MKTFGEYLTEAESDNELVDDVVSALKKADAKSVEVLDGGDNFNVSFEVGETEYYVRPNDKGDELYYIDADIDDFKSFKVKDTAALTSKVKSM